MSNLGKVTLTLKTNSTIKIFFFISDKMRREVIRFRQRDFDTEEKLNNQNHLSGKSPEERTFNVFNSNPGRENLEKPFYKFCDISSRVPPVEPGLEGQVDDEHDAPGPHVCQVTDDLGDEPGVREHPQELLGKDSLAKDVGTNCFQLEASTEVALAHSVELSGKAVKHKMIPNRMRLSEIFETFRKHPSFLD